MKVTTTVAMILLCSIGAHAANPYGPEETLQIERACVNLGLRYAQYVDRGEGPKVASLFHEDGTFVGPTNAYHGREDITLAFSQRPKDRTTLHLVSNVLAEIKSKDLATVDSYYIFYRHDGKLRGGYAPLQTTPYAMGQYRDECTRGKDGTWLWQKRELHRTFLRPEMVSN